MQEASTSTTAGGSSLLQAGSDLNVDSAESNAPAANAADGPSRGPEEESPQGTVGVAAHDVSSAGRETCASHSPAANPVVRVSGLKEIGRDGKTSRINSWKLPFQVEKGLEASFVEICERAESLRDPLHSIPLPTGVARFESTIELFGRLQDAIAEQAPVPAHTSALLCFWTLSTWFNDALVFAPGLVIVGPAHEGDLVLRALRNYCRYPLMLTRADVSSLQKVSWESTPTLLFYDPNVSKQMASILTCSASRGYMVGCAEGYKDFYGPKAIYVGQEAPVDRTPRCYLQVSVNPANAGTRKLAVSSSESTVQTLQNQLMMYRQKNLVKVYHSQFDATVLTSETRAITNALGACLVDAPNLQSELIGLLTPVESQRQADRATSFEAVTLEAALNLAHAGKAQIFVGEVTKEVNCIVEARGERLRFSAEKIGHLLKKVGLVTRRLGKSGNGLVLDLATLTRVHELATVYGGVGLDRDEMNLHCSLCAEIKSLM
jgi:hypothetical protein